MMRRIAHLADDAKPKTTLCGMPWEDWQDPTIPSNDEIGWDDLSDDVRAEVRKSDEARRPKPRDEIVQCQACVKAAFRA